VEKLGIKNFYLPGTLLERGSFLEFTSGRGLRRSSIGSFYWPSGERREKIRILELEKKLTPWEAPSVNGCAGKTLFAAFGGGGTFVKGELGSCSREELASK